MKFGRKEGLEYIQDNCKLSLEPRIVYNQDKKYPQKRWVD